MSVTNPDKVVTKQDLANFYTDLLPYLGGNLPVMGKINKSDIYDTTEKIVGKWTNGKPLYCKYITYSTISAEKSAWSPTGSNVLSGLSVDIIPITYIGATDGIGWYPTASGKDGTNGFTFYNPRVTTLNSDRAIIYYTKTTDAANSYNYADENDYSTTEKIVGTWIDGKTLYQKTIQSTLPTVTTEGTKTTRTVSLGTTVVKCVDAKVVIHNPSVGVDVPLPFENAGANNSRYLADFVLYNNSATTSAVKNVMQLNNNKISWSELPCEITIKYTKT